MDLRRPVSQSWRTPSPHRGFASSSGREAGALDDSSREKTIRRNSMRTWAIFFLVASVAFPGWLRAEIEIDSSDPEFVSQVTTELDLMRQGKRGVVCRALLDR